MLVTPQRSLELEAGKHEVTLFHLQHDIEATIEVVIEPNRTTKLIRDFTSKMARRPARRTL